MTGEPSNQPRPGGALQRFLQGFVYAGKGICSFVQSERNARFHCLAIAVVTAAGFYFGISHGEWIAVVLCFGMVLAAEGFNSAIERLVNLVSPGRDPLAGDIKDVAAGAVLVCAIAAAVVGLIIFLPYLLP